MPTDIERAERIERERRFHDDRFADESRVGAGKYYEVDSGNNAYEHWVDLAGGPGSRVLEYGCGKGSKAFALASRGARTTGIDISFVGVSHAAEESSRRQLDGRFVQMDAERLGFAPETFDLVCGSGILHHLDIEESVREIHRVLRPGGEAVFYEPLGTNPVINLYRRLTPKMRTSDEHPLIPSDLGLMRSHFRDVDVSYHNLLSLAGVALRRIPWVGSRLVAGLQRLDRIVFERIPPARRFAWVTVIRLQR